MAKTKPVKRSPFAKLKALETKSPQPAVVYGSERFPKKSESTMGGNATVPTEDLGSALKTNRIFQDLPTWRLIGKLKGS